MLLCRRILLAAALALLAVSTACAGSAAVLEEGYDVTGQLAALERIAEQVYEAAKAGDVELSRDRLEQYTAQMTKITFNGVTGAEGMNALTQTLVQTKEVFNKASFSRREGLIAAVQLRLVTDALSRKNEPMWLEYRQLLVRDAEELTSAVNNRDATRALEALKALYGHYGIVRPAAMVTRGPSVVAKADSLLSFMRKELSAKPPNFARSKQGTDHLGPVLAELFGREAETGGPVMLQQQPTLWTGILATAIVTVLSYVAWRKYNADKRFSLRRPRQ